MSVKYIECNIGTVATFDDPYGSGIRMVAAYIPGGVDDGGEFVECAWVDAVGGYWKHTDIEANNPIVVTEGLV